MTEICEHCDHEFKKKSDKKLIYTVCSETCRTRMYQKRDKIADIEAGNFHAMSVSKIESLGFTVLVVRKDVTRRN